MLVRGVPDQQANLNHKEKTMLEHYFCCPRTLYQMRLGPLGEFIDELAGEIKDEGYSKWTARHLLKGAAHFSRYMLWKGIENIEEINMDQINDFLTGYLQRLSQDSVIPLEIQRGLLVDLIHSCLHTFLVIPETFDEFLRIAPDEPYNRIG